MFKRSHLMNEEGGSPGGGSAPSAPASPAATNGAATPAPVVDVNAIKGAVTEAFAELRNGLFADLRKSGALKPTTTTTTAPDPAPAASAPTAATGMTATEVQQLLARERAFERAIAPMGLTDEQRAQVEQVYQALKPDDPYGWATGFLKSMGLGAKNAHVTNPQPQQAPAPAPVQATTPTTNVSDRGPAVAGAVHDVETFVQTRPMEMTRSDFARLEVKVGKAKALELVQSSVNAYLAGIKLVPDTRRTR